MQEECVVSMTHVLADLTFVFPVAATFTCTQVW
uniref:Uncharacterized protein n=1 Tax=Rhizophora mucronata TaxID=61149 RepID=A0A2P2KY04_RHIMU